LESRVKRAYGGRHVVRAAAILGVGLSGFFDGILLHQVLQWHHLLSLVPGEAFRDIGTQILADGLFHVLMYAITALGLLLLWRRREALSNQDAGWRAVAAGGLIGFGAWNMIDVGFFHWILGIHRIRVNVPDPMLYDVAWLALLGLIPLIAGWLLLRAGGGIQPGHGKSAAAAMTLLALVGAPVASLPPPGTNGALVLLKPGASAATAFNVAARAQAPILWADPRGRMMAVSIESPGTIGRLYGEGVMLVTRSPALAGCAAAIRA
jgi:uncharacterized membrane protein